MRARHALPLKKTKPGTVNSINQSKSESLQTAFAALSKYVNNSGGWGVVLKNKINKSS